MDVVKWDGHPDLLAWRFPAEALTTGSQLIVNESQEAFVAMGGVYDGPFGAGRHVIKTENLPILRTLYELPYGGRSPFSAEVWFVNRVANLNVKWGTPDPIQLQDPKFGVMVPVRSYGQYGLEIIDSKKFLLKLVGTLKNFTTDHVVAYFRGKLISHIKTEIARTIIDLNISVLEVSTRMIDISEEIASRLSAHFAEYGLGLLEFNVHSINVPESDPAVLMLKNALAKRAEMGIVGYSYQQERGFDVLQEAASNDGLGGGIIGAGVGLAAGAGIGAGVGAAMSGIGGTLADSVAPVAAASRAAPAPQADTSAEPNFAEKIGMLKQLAELREAGILTQEEFDAQKKKLIG